MPQNKEQEILEKMMAIDELIEQSLHSEDKSVGTINYYKDFTFEGANFAEIGTLAENDIYVARVEDTKNNTNTYEIYSGETNSLIATVDEQGRLRFMPEYIEKLRQIDPRLAEMLNLEDLNFELPRDLSKDDRVLTREEREHIASKTKQNEKEKQLDEEKKNEEENDEDKSDKSPEEEKQEEIANKKGIPTHNVLFVRTNSNLYKDHPNLEPNLYFYRDNDGVVKAEYLDSNGEPQPSQYFEASTTSLRQETVSLGDDGNPVTKEVPYQVMRTKGLNNVDKDIRDVRMTVNIDAYGYLEIGEARQGKNGEWLSHEIEVKGRDYNSRAVNESTSIRNRKADPDKQTEAYEKVEDTGLAQDGINYSEMYIIGHSDEVVEHLIKEGYQKKEAVQIIDYVIGEEKLTFKEAKERVNREIGKEEQSRENEQKPEQEREEDEGRTQGGDAWERLESRKV